MTRSTARLTPAILVVLAMATGAAVADVYVTSPETGRIIVMDGAGQITRVIGEAGGLSRPWAIAVDARRNLLVTDYAMDRVLRYAPDGSDASIVATRIPRPDGLSVAPSGDLFLVSRDDTETGPKLRLRSSTWEQQVEPLRDVWMIPMGGTAVRIASIAESTRLAGTAILSSGPFAGDLVVLSTRPGMIARFHAAGPAEYTREADFATGIAGEPTGIAVSRTGKVLVSTSDGRVVAFSDEGQRLSPDFATGLAAGPSRISVNFDGVVHVTHPGSSVINRYDAHANRLADLTVGVYPAAAALTSACVPTPAGQLVSVSPAAGVNVTFDNVTQAGETCLVTTALGAGSTVTPQMNTIPSYARKLWEDPGFVVYQLTTTTSFTDTIASDFFSMNPDARVLHASGSGNVMQDTTVLVTPDDPRARTKTFSEFVVYLDTRPRSEVILDKLSRLQEELDAYGPSIDPAVRTQIELLITQVADLIGQGGADSDATGAIDLLKQLKALVRQYSGEGIPNIPGVDGGGNPAGGLVSLADTLIFSLGI